MNEARSLERVLYFRPVGCGSVLEKADRMNDFVFCIYYYSLTFFFRIVASVQFRKFEIAAASIEAAHDKMKATFCSLQSGFLLSRRGKESRLLYDTPAVGSTTMTLIKAWTTKKFARLGLWLANAFGFGVDAAQATATKDTWSSNALASFGLEMSKGFGIGL